MHSGIIFRQLFEHVTSTYTYLLACRATKEALLIDPVIETVDRDLQLVKDFGLQLKYAGNTHVHADHVTGTGEIQKLIPSCRTFLSGRSNGKCDIKLNHKDKIKLGMLEIEARCTPGHTDGCMTFVCHPMRSAFTGDALLIRGCGRTDFQQGNPSTLYKSIHEQVFSLPPDFLLYPGHDYKGMTVTSVEEEMRLNPRLSRSLEEFVKIMNELNLALPKRIQMAVPANMVNGEVDLMPPELRKAVSETATIH